MRRWIFLVSFVFCLLLVASGVTALEKGTGIITGKIMSAGGEALSGGYVKFFDAAKGYSPFTHEYWRSADYYFRIEDDGSFSAALPEGDYYLMAVKMKKGKKAACPPEEGDFVYPPFEGTQETYAVKSGETKDLNLISRAVPFKKEWSANGKTGIQGIVLDNNGKPLEGKLVIAFDADFSEKPFFSSDSRTDRDGAYVLRTPEGGKFNVRVMGYKQPVVTATVQTGKITEGIDIKLEKRPAEILQ